MNSVKRRLVSVSFIAIAMSTVAACCGAVQSTPHEGFFRRETLKGLLAWTEVVDAAEDNGVIWEPWGGVSRRVSVRGNDLYARRLSDDTVVRLTDHKKDPKLGGGIFNVQISPDGKRVAFQSNMKGDRFDGRSQNSAWILRLVDSKLTSVLSGARCHSVAWSPKGDLLGVLETRGQSRTLHLVDSDGSRRRGLRISNAIEAWGWCGPKNDIVYADYRQQSVVLCSHKGRILRTWKLPEAQSDHFLTCSPDGTRVALFSDHRLYFASRNSPFRSLAGPTQWLSPQEVTWSPRGGFLAIHGFNNLTSASDSSMPSAKHHWISVIDSSTGKGVSGIKQWTGDLGDPPQCSLLGWSRDEKYILLIHLNDVDAEGRPGIWAHEVSSRHANFVCRIPKSAVSVAWQP